jgi:putative NADPH-quinone reductase
MSYIRILSISQQKGFILKHKIALVLGHPNASSYCAGLADAYAQAAQEAGHELRWVYGMPAHYQMRYTILGFCGSKTTQLLQIGQIHRSKDTQRAAWREKVKLLALLLN